MGTSSLAWWAVLFSAATSASTPPSLRARASELSDLGPLDAPALGPCALEDEPLAARIERRTRPLLGAAYARSPLGEGKGRDDDPRIRFDAFDCTTWVETALALAMCDGRTLLERLDGIRYVEARVSFEGRRHLVSAQWVPGLEAAGLLHRATARRFPDATRRIELRLGPRRWEGRRIAKTLPLSPEAVPFGSYEVSFVPVRHVRTSSASFAPGTIVNVVRVDWYLAPDVVTHQGIVVERDDAVVVRHASARAGRVVDEPLPAFVARLDAPRKWPVAGFQLLEISLSNVPESGTKSAGPASASPE